MNIVEMYVVSRELLQQQLHQLSLCSQKCMLTLPGQLLIPGNKKKQISIVHII